LILRTGKEETRKPPPLFNFFSRKGQQGTRRQNSARIFDKKKSLFVAEGTPPVASEARENPRAMRSFRVAFERKKEREKEEKRRKERENERPDRENFPKPFFLSFS
jgi:hypothetical protein|tara:strand:- start:151 stop:468 length:318 start_codon:yes stop_codon:yes gene_type:complete